MDRLFAAVGLGLGRQTVIRPNSAYQGWISALALTIIYVGLGTAPPTTAVLLRDIPPFTLTTLRNLSAALIFLVMIVATKTPIEVRREDALKYILAGAFGSGIAHVLLALGLTFTTVVSTSLLNSLTPIMVVLVAAVYLRERLTWRLAGGISLAFAGVVALSSNPAERWLRLGSSASIVGDLLIVLATALNAISLVLSKDLLERVRPIVVLAALFSIGGLTTAPFSLFELVSGPPVTFTWQTIGLLSYLALVIGVLSHMVWIWVLQWSSASKVGAYLYIAPVSGLLIGAMFLGETLTQWTLAAAGLIFAGLGLTSWSQRSSADEPG